SLTHLYRFTGPQELDELDDFHVELSGAVANCADGCLHALDIAEVIGPPDVDHAAEAAIELRLVIRNVGSKIRVAAFGFLARPVAAVPESRGRKRVLLALLPVPISRPLGGRQAALVDLALGLQPRDDLRDRVLPPVEKRALEKKHIVTHVQGGKALPYLRH